MMEQEKELQSPRSRREHVSTFRRYRLGWVLLGMIATEAAVVLANGSVAAAIMLPLIVGAFIFRSALVENYNRRQAEETQENP